MKKIFFILLGIIYFTQFVFAETVNINGLYFVEDDIFGGVNELIEIKVETRNSQGVAEKVSETNDVSFKTSSETGQFLNTTGGDVSTTMSKNTASRTFYYKDSAEGLHTLTVEIKGRETGVVFSATTNIKIGQVVEKDDDEDDKSISADDTSSSINTHSSQATVSTYKSKKDVSIDAGRERVSNINTPISFYAETSKEVSKQSKDFIWSFGDGSSDTGYRTNHTYFFPGEYLVVLNYDNEYSRAVSRTKVKIVEPKISFSYGESNNLAFVSIKNESNEEVNIGSWKIKGAKYSFFVSPDTIIKAKGEIKIPFPKQDTSNIVVMYPNEVVYHEYDSSIVLEEKKALEADIARLQTELQNLYRKSESKMISIEKPISSTSTTDTSLELGGLEKDNKALLLEVLKEEKQFKIPGFNFIKNIFLNE